MKRIDFNNQLEPGEFEDLGCDIVDLRENIILERFKKNKDLGIDGRYISKDGLLIVQCKRFENVNDLINKLKNEELEKVQRLNPDRYILVLSSNLTVNQKTKIYDLFNNFICSPNDIITAEDINSYLRKSEYSSIAKYYSEIILAKNTDFNYLIETIKNPNLKNKSTHLLNDIEDIKKYFVETKTYNLAYNSLLTNHIVFLSGDAGSGKTTNAKMLLNQLLEENHVDFIYKIDSCEELSNLILSEQKIGILYDDFWGSTFSDLKLSLNSEKRLSDLLYKISNMNNIYFILTTREYVLRQGLSFYKDFNNKNLDKRIIHKNCNYTDKEKINILFSHAKNSNLDFDCLYNIKVYANNIINSSNYSPRSISYFINNYQDTILNADEFIDTFLNYLRNPTDFLRATFYKLSEGAQVLAFLLSISDPDIYMPFLKKSFECIAKKIDSVKPSMFEEYIKELFDFFIINVYNNPKFIDFTNYSIFDFINNEFSIKFVDYEESFCNGVIYFNQIYNLLKKFELSIDNQNILIDYIIKNFDELLITHDDEILISSEDFDVKPITYESHKIWKLIKIVEKINNDKLKNFLFNKINALMERYENKIHHYEDNNFVDITDIIGAAEKIGITFCAEKVIKFYLSNFNYLFELNYVKCFPKRYKDILDSEMKKLGEKLKSNIENRLLNELYILSFDGISMEYEFTIEDLPNILKMLGIPKSKAISNILNDYKHTTNQNMNLQNYSLKIKEKKTSADKEIEKFGKQLFYKNILSKTKWTNIVRQSSLNEDSKKQLLKSTKDNDGIWSLLSDSISDFAYFLISFYQKEDRKELPLITTKKIFPSLLEFINDLDAINFLKKYAYDTAFNSYSPLSNNHVCNNYNISNYLIDKLIQLGVLYKNNNIIDFTSKNFEIFLSIMYMKDNNNCKEDYLKFLLRDGILRNDELSFMEEFNAYHFNRIVLLPILELILKQGRDKFKENILNIDFEEDGMSTAYSDEMFLIDKFMDSLFGISISSNIYQIYCDDSKSSFNCLNYYKQNIDILKNKQIDDLCDTYFELFDDLYGFLKELKTDKNFYVDIDEDNELFFVKC